MSEPDALQPDSDAVQPHPERSFARLALPPAVLENLARIGYVEMTPIQAASLPFALAGRDLIAQAQTGTGKTAAFALALLNRLDTSRFDVQALVLCPTRELAEQVAREMRRLARAEENVKVLALFGGTPIGPQLRSLEHGAHVVVGTPGRLLDHLRRGSLKLGSLSTLVLDEADRMLDMGFIDDIESVVSQCPATRQTLLFSATFPEPIVRLAERFLRNPERVQITALHAQAKIRQHFFRVRDDERLEAVARLLSHYRPERSLAFCNTKQRCRDLLAVLRQKKFVALALHGELEQNERDEVLAQFSNRSCSVLVATDVAARGLDIAELEAVINVELSPDPEVHIHRIGRTGRVDEAGLALSLVGSREGGYAERIEELRNEPCEWHQLDELDARQRDPLLPPMVTLQLLAGRRDKLRAGDVLGALTGEAGLDAKSIGKIQVMQNSTCVAVERRIAQRALQRLAAGKVKGRSLRVRLLSERESTS